MVQEELIQGYKKYLNLRHYAEETIRKYEKEARNLIVYMQEHRGIERVQEIKKEDLRKYQNRIYSQKRKQDGKALAVITRGGRIGAVKNFFKYLIKKAEILYNPAADIETPIVRKERVMDVLKVREMRKILGKAQGRTWLEIRDRAIMEVLYSTGMRNSELRELKIGDVDLEQGEVRIRKGKGYFGKRERVVPIGRVAIAYVEEYLKGVRGNLLKGKDEEYLFITNRGNKLRIEKPNRIIKAYALRAGIEKRVKAHMIRHTCATHLLKGGADIRYVQELLGHSTLESTKVYTKIEISDLKKVHQRSHPRERL